MRLSESTLNGERGGAVVEERDLVGGKLVTPQNQLIELPLKLERLDAVGAEVG